MDGGFFFSSRRRHTRCGRDWSSDVCSSDLARAGRAAVAHLVELAADDAAVHRHGRAETVAALATLAAAPVGLGAGGSGAPDRIRRLSAPPPTGRAATLLLAVLVVAVPL